jgi:hypothetical protein
MSDEPIFRTGLSFLTHLIAKYESVIGPMSIINGKIYYRVQRDGSWLEIRMDEVHANEDGSGREGWDFQEMAHLEKLPDPIV